ncbi:hypothetical protein Rsub_09834 [Raphidocelis subcapitata]|uniref:Uncharacterized protein n=1 Tax=Raphidocelis subcapitata TaxID=307507 RepID=A0A2V0PC30_9CHLO|nr:hypothetical protein Rsub_09834 [Raphidocelis subcapitata]|eukprot:GBF96492.1 hypothetical protein Rsub_09834 [Raphidocelis subcapitata]
MWLTRGAGRCLHALHAAAAAGDAGAIQGLLDTAGAPGAAALLRAVDGSGRTPLWLAAAGGHAAAVRLLLERGADRHAAAADGSLPISCAARQGHASVVQALVEGRHCGGRTAWHCCARTGDATSARALLSEASWVAAQPVDSKEDGGATALMVAAAAGQLDVLALLLGAGASLDAIDDDGWTALHYAASHYSPGAVQALIRAGADVNAAAGFNHIDDCDVEARVTPLHLAARYTDVEVLRLLIDSGASVSQTALSGRTAIDYAARSCCLESIRLLLARGADALVAADRGRAVAEAVVHGRKGDGAAALLLVRSGAATPGRNVMRKCVYVHCGYDDDFDEDEEYDDPPHVRDLVADCLGKLGEWLARPLREDACARAGLQQLVVGAAAAGRRAQREERAAEEAAERTAGLRAEAAALEARIAQAEARLASLPLCACRKGRGRRARVSRGTQQPRRRSRSPAGGRASQPP